MSGGDRETLPVPDFDENLDDFTPRKSQGQKNTSADQRTIDTVSAFPSREASPDTQINLKGPRHILERFKALCKADRRPYYDMLEILMDYYKSR